MAGPAGICQGLPETVAKTAAWSRRSFERSLSGAAIDAPTAGTKWIDQSRADPVLIGGSVEPALVHDIKITVTGAGPGRQAPFAERAIDHRHQAQVFPVVLVAKRRTAGSNDTDILAEGRKW